MSDNNAKCTKPPLGVMPRNLHDEARLRELLEAVLCYLNAKRKIDPEWINEINYLLKRFEEHDIDEGFYKKNFLKTFGIEDNKFVVKQGAGDAVPTMHVPCTEPAESTLVEYKDDKIEDKHTCLNCKHCVTISSDINWFVCNLTNKEILGDPIGQSVICWKDNNCPGWEK